MRGEIIRHGRETGYLSGEGMLVEVREEMEARQWERY